MLRTKLSHVDEGGVAAGLGALDSVFLVDVDACCEDKCDPVNTTTVDPSGKQTGETKCC